LLRRMRRLGLGLCIGISSSLMLVLLWVMDVLLVATALFISLILQSALKSGRGMALERGGR
jgi:hypothetical protein